MCFSSSDMILGMILEPLTRGPQTKSRPPIQTKYLSSMVLSKVYYHFIHSLSNLRDGYAFLLPVFIFFPFRDKGQTRI